MSTSVHPSVPSTTIYTQHPPATVYVLPVSHLKYSPSPIMKCWILSSQLERPMVSNAQSFQPRVFQLILILSDVLYTNYLITSYISLNLGYWTYNKVCIFFFFFLYTRSSRECFSTSQTAGGKQYHWHSFRALWPAFSLITLDCHEYE